MNQPIHTHSTTTTPETEAEHLRRMADERAEDAGGPIFVEGGGGAVAALPRPLFVREAALRLVIARAVRGAPLDALAVEAAIDVASCLYDMTQGD